MNDFHLSAETRFNQRAELLINERESSRSATSPREGAFVPDRPISGVISDADIAGPIKSKQYDSDGLETGRSISSPNASVVFEDARFAELIDLARAIHKSPPMRTSVSFDSLIDWIVDWSFERKTEESDQPLTRFLLTRRAKAVGLYQMMVPLHEPFVQSAFEIEGIQYRPLDAVELAKWFTLPENTPEHARDAGEKHLAKLRATLQARTAVIVELEAERALARQLAWETAERGAAVVRVMSKGMFFPRARTNCVPIGLAVSERQQIIELREGALIGWSDFVLDPESLGDWRLGSAEIEKSLPYLREIGRVVETSTPTEFEKDVGRSFLLYSRIALTRDVSEKLIHLFAALESLLLRSATEPIQSAISERVAFVSGKNPAQRSEIARLLKHVYGLRSRFVHHGREPVELEDIRAVKQLLYFTWTFFYKVIFATRKFKSKGEFLDSLEARKWQ